MSKLDNIFEIGDVFKPMRVLMIGVVDGETATTDISDGFAIVRRSFIPEVCHERCQVIECNSHDFSDMDGECLVVSDRCPYYTEAFMMDVRKGK